MKIIDISWPLTDKTTTYKNKNNIRLEPTKTFEADAVRETHVSFGAHSGTHVDAPSHFLQQGKTIDQVPLGSLIGPARVIDCTSLANVITADFLAQHTIEPGDIILFKTRNSEKSPFDAFDFNFIYLSTDAADYLVKKKIKAVGIDYLGIERDQKNHETHVQLMNNNISIIEGLRLEHVVEPKEYLFLCLPLALVGIEAAPARAVLITDDVSVSSL